MVKLLLAAASREPKLAECAPLSILRSLMQAAELGLEVCSGKNEAYIIPRWNSKAKCLEATFLPGYQGLIKLARESGSVRNIEARVVHAKDFFEYEEGTTPRITHRPTLEKDCRNIVAVYAVAFMPDGSSQFEVMPVHVVEEIRDRAKKDADGFSPWKSDFSEMARKTAVRRLAKYLPKSTAMAKALEIQAKAEAGDYDLEGETLRPGDANPPELRSSQEDGFWVWSEEDKVSFLNMMDDLKEACIKAKLSETKTEEKIGFYMEQKRACEDSPEKVMNRVHTAIEGLEEDAKKLEAKS
jgi:phage RecT family recombinase